MPGTLDIQIGGKSYPVNWEKDTDPTDDDVAGIRSTLIKQLGLKVAPPKPTGPTPGNGSMLRMPQGMLPIDATVKDAPFNVAVNNGAAIPQPKAVDPMLAGLMDTSKLKGITGNGVSPDEETRNRAQGRTTDQRNRGVLVQTQDQRKQPLLSRSQVNAAAIIKANKARQINKPIPPSANPNYTGETEAATAYGELPKPNTSRGSSSDIGRTMAQRGLNKVTGGVVTALMPGIAGAMNDKDRAKFAEGIGEGANRLANDAAMFFVPGYGGALIAYQVAPMIGESLKTGSTQPLIDGIGGFFEGLNVTGDKPLYDRIQAAINLVLTAVGIGHNVTELRAIHDRFSTGRITAKQIAKIAVEDPRVHQILTEAGYKPKQIADIVNQSAEITAPEVSTKPKITGTERPAPILGQSRGATVTPKPTTESTVRPKQTFPVQPSAQPAPSTAIEATNPQPGSNKEPKGSTPKTKETDPKLMSNEELDAEIKHTWDQMGIEDDPTVLDILGKRHLSAAKEQFNRQADFANPELLAKFIEWKAQGKSGLDFFEANNLSDQERIALGQADRRRQNQIENRQSKEASLAHKKALEDPSRLTDKQLLEAIRRQQIVFNVTKSGNGRSVGNGSGFRPAAPEHAQIAADLEKLLAEQRKRNTQGAAPTVPDLYDQYSKFKDDGGDGVDFFEAHNLSPEIRKQFADRYLEEGDKKWIEQSKKKSELHRKAVSDPSVLTDEELQNAIDKQKSIVNRSKIQWGTDKYGEIAYVPEVPEHPQNVANLEKLLAEQQKRGAAPPVEAAQPAKPVTPVETPKETAKPAEAKPKPVTQPEPTPTESAFSPEDQAKIEIIRGIIRRNDAGKVIGEHASFSYASALSDADLLTGVEKAKQGMVDMAKAQLKSPYARHAHNLEVLEAEVAKRGISKEAPNEQANQVRQTRQQTSQPGSKGPESTGGVNRTQEAGQSGVPTESGGGAKEGGVAETPKPAKPTPLTGTTESVVTGDKIKAGEATAPKKRVRASETEPNNVTGGTRTRASAQAKGTPNFYGNSTYKAAMGIGMGEDQARAAGFVAYKTAREAERLGLDVPSVVASALNDVDPTGKLKQAFEFDDQILIPAPRTAKAILPKGVGPKSGYDTGGMLDEIEAKHPNPFASAETWQSFLEDVQGTIKGRNIPNTPNQLVRYANDADFVTKDLEGISPSQRDLTNKGLAAARVARDSYDKGAVSPQQSAEYLLWGILSRRASPKPHETAFLLMEKGGVGQFIDDAFKGKFNLNNYLTWVNQTLSGTEGAGATANANSFGKTFLAKVNQKVAGGPLKGMPLGEAWHEVMANPGSAKETRRLFQSLGISVGIDNKVLDLLGLITGKTDAIPFDRVRFNDAFPQRSVGKQSGVLPYSQAEVQGLGSGLPGAAFYEGVDRSISPNVARAYRDLIVKQFPGLGRWHWETWVKRSDQEVSHVSQNIILDRNAIGSKSAVPEGRYEDRLFGATAFVDVDGKIRHGIPLANGKHAILDQKALNEFKQAIDEEVVPKGFKRTQHTDSPWIDNPAVDRRAYDAAATRLAADVSARTPSLSGQDSVRRLPQLGKQGLKGLYDRVTNEITLIKGNADISSIIHENGHALKEILLQGENSDLIRKLYGDSADVKGHERFARHLENYFRTGKAPDSKMAQLFESIKGWMRDIYTKWSGGSANAEVKAIFDRVYGTSDARTDAFLKAFDEEFKAKSFAEVSAKAPDSKKASAPVEPPTITYPKRPAKKVEESAPVEAKGETPKAEAKSETKALFTGAETGPRGMDGRLKQTIGKPEPIKIRNLKTGLLSDGEGSLIKGGNFEGLKLYVTKGSDGVYSIVEGGTGEIVASSRTKVGVLEGVDAYIKRLGGAREYSDVITSTHQKVQRTREAKNPDLYPSTPKAAQPTKPVAPVKTPKATVTPAEAKPKEPWEMTPEEYNSSRKSSLDLILDAQKRGGVDTPNSSHTSTVVKAMVKGLDVPDDVALDVLRSTGGQQWLAGREGALPPKYKALWDRVKAEKSKERDIVNQTHNAYEVFKAKGEETTSHNFMRSVTSKAYLDRIRADAGDAYALMGDEAKKRFDDRWLDTHKRVVTDALKEGKPVPQNVIDEYVANGGKLPETALPKEATKSRVSAPVEAKGKTPKKVKIKEDNATPIGKGVWASSLTDKQRWDTLETLNDSYHGDNDLNQQAERIERTKRNGDTYETYAPNQRAYMVRSDHTGSLVRHFILTPYGRAHVSEVFPGLSEKVLADLDAALQVGDVDAMAKKAGYKDAAQVLGIRSTKTFKKNLEGAVATYVRKTKTPGIPNFIKVNQRTPSLVLKALRASDEWVLKGAPKVDLNGVPPSWDFMAAHPEWVQDSLKAIKDGESYSGSVRERLMAFDRLAEKSKSTPAPAKRATASESSSSFDPTLSKGDKVIVRNPLNGLEQTFEYRSGNEAGRSVVWDGKKESYFPTEWIRREEKPTTAYEKPGVSAEFKPLTEKEQAKANLEKSKQKLGGAANNASRRARGRQAGSFVLLDPEYMAALVDHAKNWVAYGKASAKEWLEGLRKQEGDEAADEVAPYLDEIWAKAGGKPVAPTEPVEVKPSAKPVVSTNVSRETPKPAKPTPLTGTTESVVTGDKIKSGEATTPKKRVRASETKTETGSQVTGPRHSLNDEPRQPGLSKQGAKTIGEEAYAKLGAKGTMDAVNRSNSENGHILSEEEMGAATEHKNVLKNTKVRDINSPEAKRISADIAAIDLAQKRVGNERFHRAGIMHQVMVNESGALVDSTSALEFVGKMEAKADRPLTDAERTKYAQMYSELETLRTAHDKAITEHQETQRKLAESENKRADAERKATEAAAVDRANQIRQDYESRSQGRKVNKADVRLRQKAAFEQGMKALRGQASNFGLGQALSDVAPHVMEFAKASIEGSKLTLLEASDKIATEWNAMVAEAGYGEDDKITPGDVVTVLAGKVKKTTTETRVKSDLQKLKDEARTVLSNQVKAQQAKVKAAETIEREAQASVDRAERERVIASEFAERKAKQAKAKADADRARADRDAAMKAHRAQERANQIKASNATKAAKQKAAAEARAARKEYQTYLQKSGLSERSRLMAEYARLQERLKKIGPAKPGQKEILSDPVAIQIRNQITQIENGIREQRRQNRGQSGIDEIRRLETQRAALQQRLNQVGPPKPKGLSALTNPEAVKIKNEIDAVRAQMRQDAADRKAAFNAMTARDQVQKRIDNLQARLDFVGPKKPRAANVLDDPKVLDLKNKLNAAKAKASREADKIEADAKFQKLSPAGKALVKTGDGLLKLQRMMILTGFNVLGKLGSATVGGAALAPFEELLGPIVGGVSRKYGGTEDMFVGKAEVDAMKALLSGSNYKDVLHKIYTKYNVMDEGSIARGKKVPYGDSTPSWEDIVNTLRTKSPKSKLDAAKMVPSAVLDTPGSGHGGVKTLLQHSAYARELAKQIIRAEKLGMDINSPATQDAIHSAAYARSQIAIFQNENALTNMWKSALGKAGAAEGVIKTFTPIVKTPTNIVGALLDRTFGILYGGLKHVAYSTVFRDKMTPEIADSITRSYKHGGVGAALVAVGWLLPKLFGGYYNGKKRENGELQPNEVMITPFGKNIVLPHWATHNMLFMLPQIGATMRHAMDANAAKSGGQGMNSLLAEPKKTNPVGKGLLDVFNGVLEQVPIINEAGNILDAASNGDKANQFIKAYLSSFFTPQFVKEYAKGRDNVKRDPQSLVDYFKMDWPGLRETVKPKTSKSSGKLGSLGGLGKL